MPYNRFVFVSRKKTISLCSIHSTQYLFFSQQMYWDNRIFFNYVNNRICARTEYYEILMLNIYTLRGNANKMCKRWDRGTKLKFVWKHTRLLCWLVCSMFNLYSVVWKTLKMLWHCLSRGGCNVSVTSRQSASSMQPKNNKQYSWGKIIQMFRQIHDFIGKNWSNFVISFIFPVCKQKHNEPRHEQKKWKLGGQNFSIYHTWRVTLQFAFA